jgi:hypothetical protein
MHRGLAQHVAELAHCMIISRSDNGAISTLANTERSCMRRRHAVSAPSTGLVR